MSLSELRKELKELRKEHVRPISKMKKADCAAELARMKAIHSGEVKKVAEVLKEEAVPAKTAQKVKAIQTKEHAKVQTSAKKEEDAKKDAMKEKMAKLRAMRKSKKESE